MGNQTTNQKMTTQEMTEFIKEIFNRINLYFDENPEELFEDLGIDSENFPEISARTFEEAGLLTRNKGVVITIGKNRFQITIVKER